MPFLSILLSTLLTILIPPLLFLTWYLHVPRAFPNLPRIPIYVSILGLWSSMGQDEIYERWFRAPLEEHGAVVVWFAGRWSILVSRPDWLTDMFRNEQLYAKAGSQIKIPHAVIATLVGDNIINAHGENWRLYTGIMKAGLQKKVFETTSLLKQSRKLVDALTNRQKETGGNRSILVNDDVQKWAVDVMGENFLDLELKSLGQPNGTVRIESLQSIIKATLFKPMYFSFPDLDHFSWLLPSRKRAYNIMNEFDNRLYAKIMTMLQNRNETDPEEMVSHMLGSAYKTGLITEKQLRDNLKITFLTAHENAQQLITSMFWQLGTRVDIQDRLRDEILTTAKMHSDPSQEIINSLPYLTAVVLELLRLFPPVCQLINRVALQPAMLGGELPIARGTFVGWNAWAVHSNPAVWGDDAREFRAERWGESVEEMQGRFRRETVRGTYIPFNAHKRKCLGQGFALLQVKILLFVLLGRVSWVVDPGYKLKMTPGGILAPLGCRVILTELKS
ncbi:hypothetical protein PENCOP_c013G07794 [Penicillium coprophilum]|uniref:Uncharacterized protein n=1 Tax=Penicillium coprophilum TaxID=36646 RepID=A0A1V6UA45_9EURO|nr:hypothetical protein PENCOP_c013G07794 [Penicillium coprophilum]